MEINTWKSKPISPLLPLASLSRNRLLAPLNAISDQTPQSIHRCQTSLPIYPSPRYRACANIWGFSIRALQRHGPRTGAKLARLLAKTPTLTSSSNSGQDLCDICFLHRRSHRINIKSLIIMADSKPFSDFPDDSKETDGQKPPRRQNLPIRKLPLPLELPILKHLNSKRVILASASPRRKALLQQVQMPSPTYALSSYSYTLVRSYQPRNHPFHKTRRSR